MNDIPIENIWKYTMRVTCTYTKIYTKIYILRKMGNVSTMLLLVTHTQEQNTLSQYNNFHPPCINTKSDGTNSTAEQRYNNSFPPHIWMQNGTNIWVEIQNFYFFQPKTVQRYVWDMSNKNDLQARSGPQVTLRRFSYEFISSQFCKSWYLWPSCWWFPSFPVWYWKTKWNVPELFISFISWYETTTEWQEY